MGARNRVTATIDPEGGLTGYGYDDAGNLTSLSDPVGNTTSWVYDNLDRVIEETNELDKTRFYAYDDGLNLESVTDRRGLKREFDFDALHQLSEERWLDASQQVIRTFDFTYDAASQLLGASDPDSTYTYTYDALGRLETVDNLGTPGVGTAPFPPK